VVDTQATNSSGQVSYHDVTLLTSYYFEAYYEGTNAFDSLGELWASATMTVNTPAAALTLRRNYPYAQSLRVYRVSDNVDVTGASVVVGTQLQLRTVVNNARSSSQSTSVQMRADIDKASPYDFDQMAAAQPIPAGGNAIFSLNFTPSTTGTFYGAVKTNVIPGGKTDSWNWFTLLQVTQRKRLINSFVVRPATVTRGESAVLMWNASAGDVTLDHGIGAQPLIGTFTVSPAIRTTYLLEVHSGQDTDAATVDIDVQDPQPILDSISPASVAAGSNDTTIILKGRQFSSASKVSLDTAQLSTDYRGDTQLVAVIPASLLTDAKQHSIVVKTPSPGGGQSSAVTFNVTSGSLPSIEIVDPMCGSNGTCEGRDLVYSGSGEVFPVDDTSRLLDLGVKRSSVSCDGTTLLVLRLRAAQPATFALLRNGRPLSDASLGSLLQRNGGSAAPKIVVTPENTGKGSYLLLLYRAPAQFTGVDAHTPAVVTITATFASSAPISTTLTLVPRPLVLIHGLWSDPTAWEKFATYLSGAGFRICGNCRADYSSADSATPSFDPMKSSASIDALITAIAAARQADRDQGIATTQVDVIGHSMGGVISRALTVYGLKPYRDKTNYKRGSICRLITIGTPHRGTPLATWLINHKDSKFCAKTILGVCVYHATISDALKSLNKPIGAAVTDLEPGSSALANIGLANVPTYAFVGIEPSHSGTEDELNRLPALINVSDTVDSLLGGDQQHDTIVPLTSQHGGLLAFSSFGNLVHTRIGDDPDPEELKSTEIQKEAATLLLGDGETFATTSLNSVVAESYSQPVDAIAAQSAAIGAGTLTLSAPSTARLGETIEVTASTTGFTPGSLIWLAPGALRSITGSGPYQFSYTVPSNGIGNEITLYAVASSSEGTISNMTTIAIGAEQAVPIVVNPTVLMFQYAGETAALTVSRAASDGSRLMVAADPATSYNVASPEIASVSREGVITAIGNGTTSVVVTHRGYSVMIPVIVRVANRRPVAPISYELNVPQGGSGAATITAFDPDGDLLSFDSPDKPPFVTLNVGSTSIVVIVNPRLGDNGKYVFHVITSDNGSPRLSTVTEISMSVGDRRRAAAH